MAELTVQTINQDGLSMSASLVAADVAGDTVNSASGLLFMVDNGSASPITVTITPPVSSATCGAFGNLAVDPIVHTVAATSDYQFTVPTGYASNDVITLAYSDVTTVSVGVFSVV